MVEGIGEDEGDKVYVIKTLDALRAFADPIKRRIIDGLRSEMMTVSQVARVLGEKPTKLYYHITELERAGLIVVVETRQKGNLTETYYQPIANFFRIDAALFENGPEALGAFYQSVSTLLDQSAILFHSAINEGRITEKEASASKRLLIRSRLSVADASEFQQRLDDLLQEFRKRSAPEAEVPILFTLLFCTEKPHIQQAATAADTQHPSDAAPNTEQADK